MSFRKIRPIRLAKEETEERLITSEGRPPEARSERSWTRFLVRLLTVAWAAAVVIAVIDELGPVPHMTLLLAMGVTGLLVGASFIMTRDTAVPRSAARDEAQDDEDAESSTDGLTNLPSYNLFQRRLRDEFARTRRIGRQMAVVLIDVNNLTAVNNEYGVQAGDEVLRHVGRTIEQTKRYSDVAARLGDDEFGVLLLDTGQVGVDAFIQRLEDRLARESATAQVDNRTISLWAGVCSGAAVLEPGMGHADQILEAAMGTLNQAKRDREKRRRMWQSA